MSDGTEVDTSIYKQADPPPNPFTTLAKNAQSKQDLKALGNKNKNSTGAYGEPSGDTVARLGAGAPYGQ